MASLSSAGIGSGLDVETIVTKLMAIERNPETQMQKQATTLQTKLSTYGKMQSYVSAFRDASSKLALTSTWNAAKVATTDAASVSFTGSASTSAAGAYAVTVGALASTQTLASKGFANTTATVGSGTLSIELGTWNAGQTALTPKSGTSAISVAVAATDTLADVRTKINNANAGVQATIVTDASGSRLMLRSSLTGEENAFRVTAQDDDGNATNAAGLSALAYDPSSAVTQMTRTQTAANASATVNGLSITSASNTLTDVVSGVSLTLNKVSADPVTVTVTNDTEALKTAVTAFAKAYNDLTGYLNSQTSYDATTKKGAAFQGDSAVNGMRASLRQLVSGTAGSSTSLTRLASIGLDIKTDGTFATNTTKLDAALANPDELRKMFLTTGAVKGVGETIRTWGDTLLATDGALTSRQTSLQKQITANTKQQADFEVRMTGVEKRMRAQYTALDTTMAKSSSLATYMTQQITAMNK